MPAELEARDDRVVKRLGYVPALDGVRAVAILSVIGFHAIRFPFGGELGVDVFFVLSGFLITTLLLNEHGDEGRLSLRAFYRRRALRLLPALFTMLAVYLAVAGMLYAAGRWNTQHAFAALRAAGAGSFYIANLASAYSDTLTGDLNHLWSLATEEQFYLVLPLVLIICPRLRLGPRRLMLLLFAVLAFVLAHRAQLVLSGSYTAGRHAFYGPDCRADGLIVGCIAGVAYTHGLTRLMRRAAAVAPLLVCLILAFGAPFAPRMLFVLPLLNLAVAAVLVNIAERPDAHPHLRRRPVVYLGRISYGLYLWHPLTIAAFGPVGALVALPVAAASYRIVEQPFLRRRHRPERVQAIALPAAAR
jgi:peptidoglycan/LPS O-acetylase OafA/YrhL